MKYEDNDEDDENSDIVFYLFGKRMTTTVPLQLPRV